METQEAIKRHWYSGFPKWLKVVLLVASIVTLVYWISLVTYKILKGIRIIGAFVFEPRNYWTFLCCILILAVGGLLLAQFAFGLDPFGKLGDWFVERFEDIKRALISVID